MMASLSADTSKQQLRTCNLSLLLVVLYSVVNSAPVSAGGSDESAMRARYDSWAAKHGRTHTDPAEKARRYEVFKSNVEFVDSHNDASGKSNSSLRLATNKFSDLTDEEFKAIYLKQKDDVVRFEGSIPGFMYGNLTESDVPASRNWTAVGAVTAVKDQAQCASCWAFSAVAAVEGIHAIRTGNLIPLSEQQLMDCSTGMNNRGCNEGDMEVAFLYIARQQRKCSVIHRRHIPIPYYHRGLPRDGGIMIPGYGGDMIPRCVSWNGGLSAETAYPYQAAQSNCSALAKKAAAFIRGFQYVPANNETALQLAVSRQPVSVALDSTSPAFRYYSSGIFGAAGVVECTNSSLNHALTAVGYGTDEHGTKYWLMKNSWGTKWGEGGYIRIARDLASDAAGVCGLAVQASYPVA